jgi:DNA polymerase-3 subunit epsilon
MHLLDAPLAIVDLETTGAHPLHDRITEIAVLEVAGGDVASEWSTLVNPQTAIPPAIQALTGITNEMVARAPTFEALAEALHERLAGRVFVAHNARFDYGFLRQEFERSGLKFQARTLCTVKLSRRLYPEHPRHNLDSVIARHGLDCRARHRALGDAQAVWQFLRAAAEERGAEALAAAAQGIVRQPALPAHLDRVQVDAIPEAPGVYLLYGERGAPLYIGKSMAMRSRVLQHFSDDLRSPRERELAREVRHIEWQRSCGELSALLKEAALVKQLAPAFNRQLKSARELCGFLLEAGKLRLAEASEIRGDTLTQIHGVFRSRRAALTALRGLADGHRLCLQTLGFEPARRGKGACFRHQVARCAGVCAGRETPQAHQARAAAALARLKTLAWPWRGPIGVLETDPEREASEMQVLHNWCWLGTATADADIAELVAGAGRALFDLDVYRILARHLGNGRARVLELQPALA